VSPARLLDGRKVAAAVRAEVREGALALRASGTVPTLAVVLVGDDPASAVYVRNKDKAAREAGFEVRTLRLPADAPQAEVEDLVARLAQDDGVHGILVQLPLPGGLDADRVLELVDPRKDVDGLHPSNVAALALARPGLRPCTPLGCIELLDREGIGIEGRRALVLGRSRLVGRPLAALLLERDATVTVAHSKSRDLAHVVGEAELVFAAIGKPRLVRGAWIREGAAVVDVGINRLPDGRLCGDVDFEAASARAGAISPVPGGVGPMTIALLLRNTLQAASALAGERA